jgi:hypothetical protein
MRTKQNDGADALGGAAQGPPRRKKRAARRGSSLRRWLDISKPVQLEWLTNVF